jgi:hypothetical protein
MSLVLLQQRVLHIHGFHIHGSNQPQVRKICTTGEHVHTSCCYYLQCIVATIHVAFTLYLDIISHLGMAQSIQEDVCRLGANTTFYTQGLHMTEI